MRLLGLMGVNLTNKCLLQFHALLLQSDCMNCYKGSIDVANLGIMLPVMFLNGN